MKINLGLTNRPSDNPHKRRTRRILDFAVPADQRVKLKKKSENRDKYLVLARELKKLLNRKITVISVVTGTFVTVHQMIDKGTRGLEIRGQVETIQTTALLNTEKSPVDLS